MLELDQVHKRYDRTLALQGLSLRVEAGTILGLLGPNGAGKSTAMHVLSGLIEPDSGHVRVAQGDPRDPATRARLGIAPQALSLYERMTGRENLLFFAKLYGLRGARLNERVDAALEFVRLTDRQHDLVEGYSGGMQRRLNIACAIVHDPDIVLLDEPTVGVDPQSRNAIFDNVLALKARGRTVVYTTHYMEEAERLCDRVGVIDHGKLLALDTPAALKRAHGGKPVLVVQGEGGEERIDTDEPLRALNELAARGPVREFHVLPPTLEQVFLNLTGRSLRD
jgi:ABC-2 type transport system ATP-binding protein